MRRVYLSGPMSILPPAVWLPRFAAAAARFRAAGWEVFNPAETDPTGKAGWEWVDWIAYDVRQLLGCTHIHFLPEAERSPGSRIERAVAAAAGIGTVDDPAGGGGGGGPGR